MSAIDRFRDAGLREQPERADRVTDVPASCAAGDRVAGVIAGVPVRLSDWAAAYAAFEEKVRDFNERGRRQQIPHPGWAMRARYCPECGARLPDPA